MHPAAEVGALLIVLARASPGPASVLWASGIASNHVVCEKTFPFCRKNLGHGDDGMKILGRKYVGVFSGHRLRHPPYPCAHRADGHNLFCGFVGRRGCGMTSVASCLFGSFDENRDVPNRCHGRRHGVAVVDRGQELVSRRGIGAVSGRDRRVNQAFSIQRISIQRRRGWR